MDNLYRLDGRVPLGKAIPFGREPTMTESRECASQFSTEAEIWKEFPKIVHDVFADNVVAVVFVVAMILSYVLPKDMEVIHKESRTD